MADIRRVARERRLTKAEIAKAAGLHVNTLLRLSDPNWDPRLSTLSALEDAVLRPPRSSST
jgi:predicted transcriptional regulator